MYVCSMYVCMFTTCVGGLLYTRPPSPDDDVLEKPLLVIIRYAAYSMLAEASNEVYVCMYVCVWKILDMARLSTTS
jgi:hypothetical protein